MFIDRNAPTGALGLGPSINEALLRQSEHQLAKAHASEDYFAASAITIAKELAAARQVIDELDDRIMAECQNGSMAMLLALGLDKALDTAINDLSLATGVPQSTLSPRYRLVQLVSMRDHASTYWWDKRYINSPVQVITMLQKSATYKPFSEAIAKLPDPTLIDERSTIPDEIAIVANNARKRLIDHDGQFRM
jgi:hypothetical protein